VGYLMYVFFWCNPLPKHLKYICAQYSATRATGFSNLLTYSGFWVHEHFLEVLPMVLLVLPRPHLHTLSLLCKNETYRKVTATFLYVSLVSFHTAPTFFHGAPTFSKMALTFFHGAPTFFKKSPPFFPK